MFLSDCTTARWQQNLIFITIHFSTTIKYQNISTHFFYANLGIKKYITSILCLRRNLEVLQTAGQRLLIRSELFSTSSLISIFISSSSIFTTLSLMCWLGMEITLLTNFLMLTLTLVTTSAKIFLITIQMLQTRSLNTFQTFI